MRITTSLILPGLVLASAASAAETPPGAPPAVVQKLLDCRAIADAGQRLACFDASVAALASGVEKREVLVADTDQVKKAKRSLFGLTLPNFNLFGATRAEGEKTDDRGALTEIEAVIRSARPGPSGNWRLELDDDSRWVQTDGVGLRHDPRAGMKIRIRRAAMGSYFANIDGQTAIRVKRIQD